ncbi:hypothetical protein [Boudabousia marimammalium]|uniref:DUF559 domain-containing protein n=1 Tax=Boudabousia marimammalium TaxID=156892 RepID=A0A1Q5PKF6_9ACTO|nr:hypothetical protein [Boudabousia marimammalium]OKL46700.1 hypothetical protein BM477_07030 [Boudabousia marimammalium]
MTISCDDIQITPAQQLTRSTITRALQPPKQGQTPPEYVRIKHGHYLQTPQNLNEKDIYEAKLIAGLARLKATSEAQKHTVFTLESACLLYGFNINNANPPISIVRPVSSNRHRYRYPPLWLAGNYISGVAVEPITCKVSPLRVRKVQGMLAVEPIELICTLLRRRPPLPAMIAVDSACQQLCKADARHREQTELRFAQLKEQVLQRLEELRHCKGYHQAKELAALMTPWAQSPLETRFRLICAAWDFPSPILQHLVRAEGEKFFLDAFFPESAVGVEIDGLSKYQTPNALAQEKRRHHKIERQGIHLIRFTFDDLRNPVSVQRELASLMPQVMVAPRVRLYLLAGW